MAMFRRVALSGLVAGTLLLAGCGGRSVSNAPVSSKPVAVRAVYLAPEAGGQLTAADLAAHPEVIVVHSQSALSTAAAGTVAIWIDKDSVRGVANGWLGRKAEAHCPIALIGYSNSFYSFHVVMDVAKVIPTTAVDWSKYKPVPGFSVWLTGPGRGNGASAKESTGTPTVASVESVTDAYLRSTQ